MDTLYINGLLFLATISEHLYYQTIKWVRVQTSDGYRSVLDNVFQIYNRTEFYIKQIWCNNQFKPFMNPIKDNKEIDMDYIPAQQYCKQAEQNNHVIKECVRTTYHKLLFKNIPKIIIKYLAMENTKSSTLFL